MGKLGTNKKCNHGEPSENCTLLLTPWRITLPIQGRMLLSLSGIGTCRVAFMLRSSIEATNGISEGAKFIRTLLGLGLSVSTIKRNYTTHRNLVLQQVLEKMGGTCPSKLCRTYPLCGYEARSLTLGHAASACVTGARRCRTWLACR